MKKLEDYTFVEKEDSELYSIKILSGPYSGVIYTYGVVSIKEGGGTATLKFDFRIEENNGHVELDNHSEFKNQIGDILVSILEDQQAQIGNATKPTSDNT